MHTAPKIANYLGYLGSSYTRDYIGSMTLSSLVVSRDWQEVSVLECVLGSLQICVDVEAEPERALAKLAKSKIDALIVDCDLTGTSAFLRGLETAALNKSIPLVIVSGSRGRNNLQSKSASFVFEKPISVEQAVHTLSAARNIIVSERLRYHRQTMDVPVLLTYGKGKRLKAHLVNLSQGGMGVRLQRPLHTTTSCSVKVSFALPKSKRMIKLQGELAWVDKQGDAGIRFADINQATKRELQLWLERQYFSQ